MELNAQIGWAAGIVFLAAMLRGLTGFGFALAAVPLLSLVMEPARAVPVSLMVVGIGGVAGIPKALRTCDWTSLRGLAIGAMVATPIGILILKTIPADGARLIIALFTIAALASIGRGGAPSTDPGLGRKITYGALAGLFNGLAAMPGPPVVAYFMATRFNREIIRSSLLVFFQCTTFLGLASAALAGLIRTDMFLMVACALPAFWIGNNLGVRLFALGSEQHYRRLTMGCLALTALGSAIPALRGLWRAIMTGGA